MDTRPFIANQWLKTAPKRSLENQLKDHSISSPSIELPSFAPHQKNHGIIPTKGFQASQFFTPGWQGDSLSSHNIKKINKLIEHLSDQIVQLILKSNQFPPRLINALFKDFIIFCENRALVLNLENAEQFWKELKNTRSNHKQSYLDFLKIYANRCAFLYTLKLRFIKLISTHAQIESNEQDLINPHAYILKVFKKNSRLELKSHAFSSSSYSWFKPSKQALKMINDTFEYIDSIGADELFTIGLKITIYQPKSKFDQETISHKNFGLFLNSIIVNNITWLKHHHGEPIDKLPNENFQYLVTKFIGDRTNALSCSHWSAQENNMHFRWQQLICPEFFNNQDKEFSFLNLVNEIQFLSFVIQISKHFPKKPLKFLSDTIKQSYQHKNKKVEQQEDLFNWGNLDQSKTYNNIVFSQLSPQKNNSHYSLLTKIDKQINNLQEFGHIIVLCNQNLFIHSVQEKSKQILKKLKLEKIINLEGTHGKGEVPNFIYIFSKIPYWQQENQDQFQDHSFYTFRLGANLKSFYEFSKITELMHRFLNSHLRHLPPLSKLEDQFNNKIEFFRDAIINGKLVQSTSNDQSQITHPHFFKKLTNKCIPLDLIFDIKAIDQSLNMEEIDREQLLIQKELLNHSLINGDSNSYIIILNFKQKENVQIEIIPKSSFKAKAYELGFTDCYYYEFTPKYKDICINVIRDYFTSPIAQQLSQISFFGSYQKIRSKLGSFLVPKFIHYNENLPEHIEEGINFLLYKQDEIMDQPIHDLESQFSIVKTYLSKIALDHPYSILKRLSYFKTNLQNCLSIIEQNHHLHSNIDFSNKEIRTQILKMATHPIYPQNNDFQIEFHLDNKENINQAIIDIKINIKREDSYIVLLSENEQYIKIVGPKTSLQLMYYIVKNMLPLSIKHFLENFVAPSSDELEKVVTQFTNSSDKYQKFIYNLNQFYHSILLGFFHSD